MMMILMVVIYRWFVAHRLHEVGLEHRLLLAKLRRNPDLPVTYYTTTAQLVEECHHSFPLIPTSIMHKALLRIAESSTPIPTRWLNAMDICMEAKVWPLGPEDGWALLAWALVTCPLDFRWSLCKGLFPSPGHNVG